MVQDDKRVWNSLCHKVRKYLKRKDGEGDLTQEHRSQPEGLFMAKAGVI